MHRYSAQCANNKMLPSLGVYTQSFMCTVHCTVMLPQERKITIIYFVFIYLTFLHFSDTFPI